MNETVDPARERLLDAALAEVFSRAPADARDDRRAAGSPPPSPPPRRRWLAAALVMLGGAVVVASALWSRGAAPHQAVTPQDPVEVEMPDEVYCDAFEELADVADDVVNLRVVIPEPGQLVALQRFTKLRRLILVRGVWGDRDAWLQAGDDALRPLLRLAKLEELRLPGDLPLRLTHVRTLEALPRLRSLWLAGRVTADIDTAAALCRLEHLTRLKMQAVDLRVGFLAALRPIGLRELELEACAPSQPDVYSELAQLAALRSLGVTFCLGMSEALPKPGEQLFAALGKLPQLVALDLEETDFDDHFFARLPPQLRRLNLGDRRMEPSTIASLARLGELEELDFHQGTHAGAAAELIAKLRLQRLRLRGWADQQLVDAVATNLTIEEATLRVRDRVELAGLARAARIERLHVRAEEGTRIPDLPAFLAACKARGLAVDWQD